jgi:hypothetical protein
VSSHAARIHPLVECIGRFALTGAVDTAKHNNDLEAFLAAQLLLDLEKFGPQDRDLFFKM